jgi:hypothetical protein
MFILWTLAINHDRMKIKDVKYKLGPEDEGLSEDEIGRKLGDKVAEFEDNWNGFMDLLADIHEEQDKTEKQRELDSKID